MGEYADMENEARFEDYVQEFDDNCREETQYGFEDIDGQVVTASKTAEQEPETSELIIIKQLPEFGQSFVRANAEIQKRLAFLKDLDISEESKNQAKKIKAELNKEFAAFEERRKFVKNEINKPYAELEELYKGHIADPYTNAIAKLTEEIGEIDRKQIAQKRKEVLEYFIEYRNSLGEDLAFLNFDRLSVTVNLSVTVKKLKDEIREKCDKIKTDIESLQTMGELADRYIACYRNLLDVSRAISTVNAAVEGEQRLKAEKESRSEAETAQKQAESKVEAVLAGTAESEVTAAVEIMEDEPAENEPRKDFPFIVRQITRNQFEKLIKFMESEGISYEWNK